MSDPFANALDAMFAAPMAADATYTPAGGQPVQIRVIRSQPTEHITNGQSQILMDSEKVEIRRSEVSQPMNGDLITIGEENFSIQGGPALDVEGLTWNCYLQDA